MNARASGKNWAQIAERNFPNKTSNACRKRHERLMERRNAEDWDGVKLETISNAYMEVRKAMWSLLAERVNEKWQTVEAKVSISTRNRPQTQNSNNVAVHGERAEKYSSSPPIV
jgi:hypothetical protein